MAYYINYRGAEGVETVDEFETRREAVSACREYNANRAFGNACYVSSRPTKEWARSSALDELFALSGDLI